LPNVYLRRNDWSTPVVLMLRGCCSDEIIDITDSSFFRSDFAY